MIPLATNLYYTYSATAELVKLPKTVHTTFSLVGMYTCLDFFPARERIVKEIKAYKIAVSRVIKVQKVALVISECSSMCMDVIWFLDEARKFTPLVQIKVPGLHTLYICLFITQSMWLGDSIQKTFFSNKKITVIDTVTTALNIVYYSASYMSYVVRPTPIIPSIQVACCLCSLASTICR